MIETTLPNVDVADLMRRVRAKAAKLRQSPAQTTPAPPTFVESEAPAESLSWPPPPLVTPTPIDAKRDRVLQTLGEAREALEAPRWVPKPFRRFFRRQSSYNRLLINAVTSIAKTNAELAARAQHLWSSIEVQHHSLHALALARVVDVRWMHAAQTTQRDLAARVRELADSLTSIKTELIDRIDTATADVSVANDQMQERLHEALSGVEGLARRASDYDALVKGLRADFDHAGKHLRNLQESFDVSAAQVDRRFADAAEKQSLDRETLQRSVDSAIAQTRQLAQRQTAVDVIVERTAQLRGDLDRAAEHLRNLQGQHDQSANELTGAQHDIRSLVTQAQELRLDFSRAGEHLRNLQTQLDRTGEHLRNLQGQHDHSANELTEAQQDIRSLVTQAHEFRLDFSRAGEHLRNLQGLFDRRTGEYDRLRDLIDRLEERVTSEGSYLKAELALQRSASVPPRGKAAKAVPSKPARSDTLDAFYLSFENRFRGKRADIKERLRFYLPYVRRTKGKKADLPVLDLGCGRGEWLELLGESGVTAIGVDSNSAMCSYCRELGIDVTHADALEYLRKASAGSFAGVTGFHIIEHLPLEVLLELFAQAYRVLQPGGVAIFESPNCMNYAVGACYFNVDPTHRNPVFPETAAFMLGNTGFERVAIEYLSPVQGSPFDAATPAAAYLNDRFFGAQDFGVIAYRPARR